MSTEERYAKLSRELCRDALFAFSLTLTEFRAALYAAARRLGFELPLEGMMAIKHAGSSRLHQRPRHKKMATLCF